MIHPLAVVDPAARVAEGVSIGAFSVIGPDVSIESGTRIGPHVVISGHTRIGRDNEILQFASVGEAPQDTSYKGEPTELIVGDRNVIREYVTMHRGTQRGTGRTVVGSDNLIMAYVHIAHDCVIGNHIIFSNAASLAGHVGIGDHAILGGFTLVHQFCRVGVHAFTGMGTALNRDLTPYTLATGNYARAVGINKLGLKRRGFSPECIRALHQVFKLLVRGRNRDAGLEAADALLQEFPHAFPEVAHFVEFVRSSKRGIVRSGRKPSVDG
ncbi:MAG: acyl-ACP--UDP-N-acetylglucosamine O-acyltransferase [Chromatiales bacterium]|jgi:UDP-N-acetylglucosamine acyltransferase|nr:acyl-ACP--UDP-N-acetylglucosamine O-acyltransferase [Chromatiales bacterium]MDX9766140.1 acyl-ACP--UDP-N-acetylglucosamine O-acyltransferase [Ectothiorhodospiraceae bacterium]